MGVFIAPGHCLYTQQILLANAPGEFVMTFGVRNPTNRAPTLVAQDLRGMLKTRLWDPFGRGTDWSWGVGKCWRRDPAGVLDFGEDPQVNAGTSSAANNTPVPNSAILVQRRTGLAGRKFRGRIFVPPFGLSEANVSAAGIMDAAVVTTFQSQWAGALGNFTTLGLDMVLLHENPATEPTLVSSLQVQARMASQRDRLRR